MTVTLCTHIKTVKLLVAGWDPAEAGATYYVHTIMIIFSEKQHRVGPCGE